MRSDSDPSKNYNVWQKRCKWSCDCPDHQHRKAQCKHMLAVMYYVTEREESVLDMHVKSADQDAVVRPDADGQPDIHIQPVGEHPEKCPSCDEVRIIKWGFTGEGESRRQRYRCKNPLCGCTFVHRGGFERTRKPNRAILQSLNDFFKGHSPNDILDSLGKAGCVVDHSSIYRWISKFSIMAHEYLRDIPIRTGERASGDEVYMSAKDRDEDKKRDAKGSPRAADARPAEEPGDNKMCLFSTTDIQTRFCLAFEMADHKDGFNATNLLKETKRRAGKVHAEFVSDALPSYSEAHQAVFAAKTPLDRHSVHISNASLKNKKRNNNFQERYNGTFRAFQRPRRGIPNPHSPITTGFFVYYNFVRPHSSLNRSTPAEAAGIIIHGADKWRTIIGNAYLAARATEAVQ